MKGLVTRDHRGWINLASRAMFLASAVGLALWGALSIRFRDAEGILEGASCLPFSLALAMLILFVTTGGRWREFGRWLSLALVGQAAALQLIRAGTQLRYQHFSTGWELDTVTRAIVIGLLIAQTTGVLVGMLRVRKDTRGWLASRFRPWQIMGIAACWLLSAATVSESIPFYALELVFAAFVQVINLGNVVLLARAIPDGALRSGGFNALPARSSQPSARRGLSWAFAAAVWVTVVASALNLIAYERHPHVQDETAYLVQARFFADGVLTMPAPPVPEAFDFYLMQFDDDQWYPSPIPGWPALLAVGAFLGFPWLVNPLLAGLNVILAFLLIERLYDRRLANWALVFLCASPWYLFMAMNFMTHMFTLTCALVAGLAVVKARQSGRSIWAWVSGIALGVGSLIRPLDGLIVAVLIGLWAIGIGGRRLSLKSLVALGLGTLMAGALIFPYNAALTGDPMVNPIMLYVDEKFGAGANAYGFGPDRGLGWAIDPFPGHGPLDGVINTNLNTTSLNMELFGWATGSLLPVWILLFSRSLNRTDLLMLGVVVVVVGAYFFYYFSGGPDFGPRYWFLVVFPCVALSVRGLVVLAAMLDRSGSAGGQGARVWIAAISLCLMAVVNYVPWRAVDKYHHYLGMRADVRRLLRDHDLRGTLVLVRGNEHPDYASAAVYNPLDFFSEQAIFAWERNPEIRRELQKIYPDRELRVLEGPSLTGGGYRFLDGPDADNTSFEKSR